MDSVKTSDGYKTSAGGIVIGEGGMLALVRSENSQSWLFPKGHVESGEDLETTARREIEEEAGLTDLEYIDDLGEYIRDEKLMHMFLFAAPKGAALIPSMEILEAKWVPYREVAEVLGTPHVDWFTKDRVWFASVFTRVREAIQRD